MSKKVRHDEKPETFKAVRIWLEDGTRLHGMWTGQCWWSTRGEVRPVEWELQERISHTPKIVDVFMNKGSVGSDAQACS